jgi:hypothetical protein
VALQLLGQEGDGSAAGVAPEGLVEACGREEPHADRLLDRPGHRLGLDDVGEVDERARGRGDRDAADRPDVATIERGAVDPQTGTARARPRGHVEQRARVSRSPSSAPALTWLRRRPAAGEDRGHAQAVGRDGGMADGVDAAVDDVEVPRATRASTAER